MSVVDFKHTFGSRSANNTQRPNNEELPKAQFWLNIGYVVPAEVEGDDDKFVSLPGGLPLDTMEKVKIKGTNREWNQFQAARNLLLDQFIEAAKKLEPGEASIIQAENGLAIQVRRVLNEVEAPATDDTNPFIKANPFGSGKN